VVGQELILRGISDLTAGPQNLFSRTPSVTTNPTGSASRTRRLLVELRFGDVPPSVFR
jgi:hypothetical protein